MAKTVMSKSVLCQLEFKKGLIIVHLFCCIMTEFSLFSCMLSLLSKLLNLCPFLQMFTLKKTCQYFAYFETVAVSSPF